MCVYYNLHSSSSKNIQKISIQNSFVGAHTWNIIGEARKWLSWQKYLEQAYLVPRLSHGQGGRESLYIACACANFAPQTQNSICLSQELHFSEVFLNDVLSYSQKVLASDS